MWSEIFTYDRDDGEKIAIILLDTQGIERMYRDFRDKYDAVVCAMLQCDGKHSRK